MKIFKMSLFLMVLLSLVFSASAFMYNGTVYNSSYVASNNTNVTITTFSPSFGAGAAGCTSQQWTNQTNASGWFVIDGINDTAATCSNGMVLMFQVSAKHYGSDMNVTETSPSLPPMPKTPLIQVMAGGNIYMGKAATIYIQSENGSGGANYSTFGYLIKDTSLGYPIAENFNNMKYNATVVVPADRNYSMMVFASGPPSLFTTTNYTLYTNDAGSIYFPITFNSSYSVVQIYGNVKNTTGGYDNYTKLYIESYMIESGRMTSMDFAIPDLGVLEIGVNHVTANATNGFYNVTIIGPASPYSFTGDPFNVAIGAYTSNGTWGASGTTYALGFQNATAVYGTADTAMDIITYPGVGTFTNISSSKVDMGSKLNFTKTSFVFRSVNDTSVIENITDVHAELLVWYNGTSGPFSIKWMMDSPEAGTAAIRMPMANTSANNASMKVFSGRYAPRTYVVNFSLNPINMNLTTFDMEKMQTASQGASEAEFGNSEITLQILKPTAACSVYVPTMGSCQIGSDFDGGFDPLQMSLGGKFNVRIELSSGTILFFTNVDMMASGPPDADMSDSAFSDDTAGSSFDQTWKFGSMAPDIYDNAMIGMPYSEASLDESGPINISFKYLYDDDWNVIWNSSNYNSSNLSTPAAYSDYNQSWFNTTVGAGVCVKGTGTNMSHSCWVNTTSNTLWITIPHFSGSGPGISGSAVSSGSSSGTTGGGTGTPHSYEREYLGTVKAGATKKISFIKSWGITSISVKAKKAFSGASVKLDTVASVDKAAASSSEGVVYKYIDITATKLNEDNTDSITLDFRVLRSWFGSKYDPDRVVLKRYVNNKWVELPTSKVNADSNYYYYQAESPGFSYFAIVTKNKGVAVKAAKQEDVSGELDAEEEDLLSVVEPLQMEADGLDGEALDEDVSKPKVNYLWMLYALGAAMALGVVIAFLNRKRH